MQIASISEVEYAPQLSRYSYLFVALGSRGLNMTGYVLFLVPGPSAHQR
jgi:hypothetical protein